MTIDTKDILNSILSSISRIDYIKPEEIPGIDLYMDQVTTFMDAHLESSKRYQEDKILTKTMINNYAKNHLLPPPEKKKYSKEHMLILIFIYYLKYFHSEEGFSITDLYQGVFVLERSEIEAVREDLLKTFEMAKTSFPDAPEEEKDFLQMFSFVCMLSFDVYLKKQMIEELIDKMPPKKAK